MVINEKFDLKGFGHYSPLKASKIFRGVFGPSCGKAALVLLLLALALFMAAGAGVAAPAVKMVSPPQRAAVGETFAFQILIEWPSGDGPYEVQAGNPLFEKIGLLHQGQSQETTASGVRTSVTLSLRALQPGDGRILPFEVRFKKPGDGPWQSMPIAGQKILIYRPFPWRMILSILLGVLVVISAAGGSFLFFRVKAEAEKRRNAPPPDPKQRVYAHAEESIVTYKGESQKETIAHWAGHLKKAVLTYYGITDKTATEKELLAALKSRSIPSGEFAEVNALFQELERLKFTRQALTVREMESLQKTLLKYVRGKIIIEKS